MVGFVLKDDFSISGDIDGEIALDAVDDEFKVFLGDLPITEEMMSDFFEKLSG